MGAVPVDLAGNVAAATSTGGITAKRWGRVGDAPLIGAGTYADNRSAAVSATGSGEYFIRAVAAHQLAERVRLAGGERGGAARWGGPADLSQSRRPAKRHGASRLAPCIAGSPTPVRGRSRSTPTKKSGRAR